MPKPVLHLPHGIKPQLKKLDLGFWICQLKGPSFVGVPFGIAHSPTDAFNSMWAIVNSMYTVEYHDAAFFQFPQNLDEHPASTEPPSP